MHHKQDTSGTNSLWQPSALCTWPTEMKKGPAEASDAASAGAMLPAAAGTTRRAAQPPVQHGDKFMQLLAN